MHNDDVRGKIEEGRWDEIRDDELIARHICPDCHSRLVSSGGCLECRNCTFYACI